MAREYDKLQKHYLNNYEKSNSEGDVKLEDFTIQMKNILDSKEGVPLISDNKKTDSLLEHIKVENLNEQLGNVMDCAKNYDKIETMKVETLVNNENIPTLHEDPLLQGKKVKEFHLKGNLTHSTRGESKGIAKLHRYYINNHEKDNILSIKLEDFMDQGEDFLDSKAGISLINNGSILENVKIENLNEQSEEIVNTKDCGFHFQEIETVQLEIYRQHENMQRDPLSEDNQPHIKSEVNEELGLKENTPILTRRKDNGDIFCKVCKKTHAYDYYYKFDARARRRNTPYICDVCKKVFEKPCLLKTHVVTHSESRPYTCKVCRKRFKRKSSAKEHQRIHFYRKYFPCNHCDRSYQSESKLEAHKLCHKIDDTVS